MNLANDIIGKWSRIENVNNRCIKEEYVFYENGFGQLIIRDNSGNLEERMFNYATHLDRLYFFEEAAKGVLNYRVIIDGNHLMINENDVVKIYTKNINLSGFLNECTIQMETT